MVKLLSFSQFVNEATMGGQMSPGISFSPDIAFAPMSENPTPDAGEQDQLNMRTRQVKKKIKKRDETQP
jgi:hypothetical protein